MIDFQLMKHLAIQSIGKPYLFGAKWDIHDPDPKGPVDCSGFVRWLYARCGLVIPDGSELQYEATSPGGLGVVGDFGFNKEVGKPTDHVFIAFDDWDVVEARGEPFNRVILRCKHRWESWPTFTGWRKLK